MATEISAYVNSLTDAGTLDGTEELYLASDEKTTTSAIAELASGKIWKAQIEQAGTSAPTVTVLVNTLGVTVTTAYVSVGNYELNGFASNLTGLTSIETSMPKTIGFLMAGNATSSQIAIVSQDTGGYDADDVLGSTFKISQIITVTKYD